MSCLLWTKLGHTGRERQVYTFEEFRFYRRDKKVNRKLLCSVMWPQVKACWQPPGAGGRKNGLSPKASGGRFSLLTP